MQLVTVEATALLMEIVSKVPGIRTGLSAGNISIHILLAQKFFIEQKKLQIMWF
jgi:hypothetical protein